MAQYAGGNSTLNQLQISLQDETHQLRNSTTQANSPEMMRLRRFLGHSTTEESSPNQLDLVERQLKETWVEDDNSPTPTPRHAVPTRFRVLQTVCPCVSVPRSSKSVSGEGDVGESSSLSGSQRPTNHQRSRSGKAAVVHPHPPGYSRQETTSATQYEEVEEGHVGTSTAEVKRIGPPVPTLRLYRSRKTFTEELVILAKFSWYWGPISRGEARDRLEGTADGSFLVRDSCSSHHLLSLSYRVEGNTYHTRIAHCNGLYSLFNFSSNDLFPSVVDLIEYALKVSEHGILCHFRPTPNNATLPVRLLVPLSRLEHLRSLQSLCRFVIRQNVRWDLISQLPLPPALARFLEDRSCLMAT